MSGEIPSLIICLLFLLLHTIAKGHYEPLKVRCPVVGMAFFFKYFTSRDFKQEWQRERLRREGTPNPVCHETRGSVKTVASKSQRLKFILFRCPKYIDTHNNS